MTFGWRVGRCSRDPGLSTGMGKHIDKIKTIDRKKFPPLPLLAKAGNGINLLFEVEYKTLPVLRTARWKWSEIICIRRKYVPIIMFKCSINIYVPVHYRTVMLFLYLHDFI